MTDSVGAASRSQVEVLTHGALSWVHVERPTELEAELLSHRYGISSAYLSESLSGQPSVRGVDLGPYAYLGIASPSQNRLTRTTSITHVGVFVGADFVVSAHRGDARVLVRLFRECQEDDGRRLGAMGRGPIGLAIEIAKHLTEPALQGVEAVRTGVQELGDSLVVGDDRDLAAELVLAERDIVSLAGVLRGALVGLDALRGFAKRLIPIGEVPEVVAAERERIERALDVLERAGAEAAGLARAGSLLAAQRTVGASRLAAALLAMLLPALVIGALFGMSLNDLPLAGYPYAFEVLLAVAIVASLIALWQLRRLRWI